MQEETLDTPVDRIVNPSHGKGKDWPIGLLVRHLAGGPTMVVSASEHLDEDEVFASDQVWCAWFSADGKLINDAIEIGCLAKK